MAGHGLSGSICVMDSVWDIYQDGRIGNAERESRAAGNKADAVVAEFARLQRRLERLALACQGMWELLRDRHGVSEEELAAKILEIDLRDGAKDGRMLTQIIDCPKCHAKTNSKRPSCVMCGEALSTKQPFEV